MPTSSQPNSDSQRSGGEVLIDGLIAGGVRCAFCVPGESYLAALDACYDRQDALRLIVCRQEGGAAYMAEAFAKLSGAPAVPGVCFVSRGPGASNAMVGIHTAFQDSTPLLLFIGQIPREERGREAFQEMDYARVYDGVAKAVLRIERAADIPAQLAQAWALAIGGRPGPVAVELPEDMLRERVAVDDVPMPARAALPPAAEAMARFEALLSQAQRPAVVFGGAAWSDATNSLLADFAARHGLPLACAFRRQDMCDNHNAHYVGELGIGPNPHLVELFRESDLVIALATRLGEMTTGGYTLFDVPQFDRAGQRKLVHVFPSADEFSRVYRADVGIECDAEAFLRAAQSIAAPDDALHRARMERVEAARESYLAFMDAPRDEGATVRMDRIMAHLRARLPPDSVIANGAGNYTIWAQRNYQFTQPNTQLASTNGSMGYSVPAGIAAKIARPDSIVVAFAGDGCFLMNGQELATAVQYNLHVIFVVVNNNRYGTIRAHQQRHYPGRPIATALNNPDFAALARAYGAFGACVRRTEEFADAFENALAAESPALIEIQLGDDA